MADKKRSRKTDNDKQARRKPEPKNTASDVTRAHAEDLLWLLDASPSPFHAVLELARRLDNAGFTPLDEGDEWQLVPGDQHYVVRQDSSLIAFIVGQAPPEEAGFDIVGAHTDSPCLKLKPRPALHRHGFLQLGCEVYGGAITATWTDRDLALAGRVMTRKGPVFVRGERPALRVPNLAIHLNRDVNKDGLKLNSQTQLVPVYALDDDAKAKDKLLPRLWRELLGDKVGEDDVLDFDLCLYDVQRATLSGRDDEFILSARLDNLASCHSGVEALLAAAEQPSAATRVLACYDHEEVGSDSAQGASSPFLQHALERISQATSRGAQAFARALSRSFCVSADMAHAVHPNYADLHDSEHMPRLGHGPVIKENSNQRYATSGKSAARFITACRAAKVTPQRFVMRNDLMCGSTIGPITATALGITTVDVGNPMLSMHSIREMAATRDVAAMIAALTKFWSG